MRRPDILSPLFSSVTRVRGVGTFLEGAFARLTKVKSPLCRDVVFHLPIAVNDRRFSPPIPQAIAGKIATFEVTIAEHVAPNRRGKPYLVVCFNESGQVILTFFNNKSDYLAKQLPVGQKRIVSGRVERFGQEITMPHPDYIVLPSERAKIAGTEPVYPLTAGMSNKQVARVVEEILVFTPELPEWCDVAYSAQKGWKSWKESLIAAHHPQTESAILQSPVRARLSYDELLANQLALALARRNMRRGKGMVICDDGALFAKIVESLPFSLTKGQQDILNEIQQDMASDDRMLRLLQGDVGSGKTVVALLAMAGCIAQRKQSALLAPTDILARQHAAFFLRVLEPLGVRVALLTGKTGTAKDREAVRERIAAGQIDVIIGTHALFQEHVAFADLALVVVDEQHRFGVTQRMQLAAKARIPPHILLMTATPIPRTLTMTAFGDMDVSLLQEKPIGRQKIDTRAMPLGKLPDIVAGLHRAIALGDKVYWICPLVEESTEEGEAKSDLAAAEARFKYFEQEFKGRVGLVHGRMKPETREPVMQGFAGDAYDILVATTVVEVGVDVPAATIMVIEHAERFGLSQLHQLRGRVGRGSRKSSCILLYRHPAGEIGEKRLRILRETEDGFRIAEEDLSLRGAGDVLGTRQSGLPDFYVADLVRDKDLALAARDDVKLILHHDPDLKTPRGEALRTLLYLFSYEEHVRLLKVG